MPILGSQSEKKEQIFNLLAKNVMFEGMRGRKCPFQNIDFPCVPIRHEYLFFSTVCMSFVTFSLLFDGQV